MSSFFTEIRKIANLRNFLNITDILISMKNKFKERLKELRKDKKLTQKQLADLLGCTNQNINDWETGNSETSFDNLLMLADIFDVTTDYLLGKDEY